MFYICILFYKYISSTCEQSSCKLLVFMVFPCISGSVWSEGISRNTWTQWSKGKKRVGSWSGKQRVEGRKGRGKCLFSPLPLSQAFIPERTRELRVPLFLRIFGVSASASFFKKNDGAFLSYYKQMCSSFDINQLLPPSSLHFPLLLHGFVLKQCTSFLSLLPNYQQEPSQGNALPKPTLERKEKTQQKQPLQTVNSKNVLWQHIWSICLLRKYSCCPGDTAGYW